MKHRSAAVASLIFASLLSGQAFAQPPATQGQPQPVPGAAQSPFGSRSKQSKTFDVTFAGGTLEQYIETLRAASKDTPVNVMLSDDVRDVRIPKVTLRGVSVFTAISALEKVSRSTGGSLSVSDYSNEGDDVIYSIRSNNAGVQQYPGGTPGSRLVVSLSNLVPADLDAAKRDERLSVVLSAIEAALRLGREEKSEVPAIALHKETGLLMVLGSSEDRQTVVSVLSEMQTTWRGIDPYQTTAIDLAVTSAPEAIRAIRDSIPDTERAGARNLSISPESPTRIVLKGAQSDILRAQGIISFIDRERPEPTELVQLRDKLNSREIRFGEEAHMFNKRHELLEAEANNLRSQLASVEPSLASAKAREETLLREIADLRKRLSESESRLLEVLRDKAAGKP